MYFYNLYFATIAADNGGYHHTDGNIYHGWGILNFYPFRYISNIPNSVPLDFKPFVSIIELIAKYYMAYTFTDFVLNIDEEDSEYRYTFLITLSGEEIQVFSKRGTEAFFLNSEEKDLLKYSCRNIKLLTEFFEYTIDNLNDVNMISEIIMYYIFMVT